MGHPRVHPGQSEAGADPDPDRRRPLRRRRHRGRHLGVPRRGARPPGGRNGQLSDGLAQGRGRLEDQRVHVEPS